MIFRNQTANIAILKEWNFPESLVHKSFLKVSSLPIKDLVVIGRDHQVLVCSNRAFIVDSKGWNSNLKDLDLWQRLTASSGINWVFLSVSVIKSHSGLRPYVCQTVKFPPEAAYSFTKCDCDLFGSVPAGNHLEEKAGLDVSSACPSIWGVSVASSVVRLA